MKKFLTLMIVVFAFTLNTNAEDRKDRDLLGVISKADLEREPYSEWFDTNYNDYETANDVLAEVKSLLKGVEIKIVMGTWCHDSKREVPRFYKILSNIENDLVNTQMIALDREKQAPGNEIDGMGITNTPTFIFYRDGQELNRIVETPVESLERDMIKILSGENYRHSNMP